MSDAGTAASAAQMGSLHPLTPFPESDMLKPELLAALQKEIYRHDFSQFVDEPPTIAEGGKGVVVAGQHAGPASTR